MSIDEILYFAHISDSHIGPTYDYSRHGHYPYACAKKMVTCLNQLPVKPDFVIHTGDIVAEPDSDAYRLAAEVFSDLNYPIYFVTGNHDRARDIHRFLPMGPKQMLSKNLDILSYAFELKGYRFVVIDARAPDEIDPHGLLNEEMLDILKDENLACRSPHHIFHSLSSSASEFHLDGCLYVDYQWRPVS